MESYTAGSVCGYDLKPEGKIICDLEYPNPSRPNGAEMYAPELPHHLHRFRSTDEVPLSALRKSKYVESCVGNSFTDVKEQLLSGRSVLFSAAPCQIAGLKSYLGQVYDHLYCCDFTCGGFPSHEIYRVYLDALEQKFGTSIVSVDFRPKKLGWQSYAVEIIFSNGRKYLAPSELDPFFYSFVYRHYSIRDNCCSCRYSKFHQSDIILADFWLYRQASDLPRNDSGISLLLANTEKGDRLIRSCAESLSMTTLDLEKASYNLKETTHSSEFFENRRQYIRRFDARREFAAIDCNQISAVRKLIIGAKTIAKRILRCVT